MDSEAPPKSTGVREHLQSLVQCERPMEEAERSGQGRTYTDFDCAGQGGTHVVVFKPENSTILQIAEVRVFPFIKPLQRPAEDELLLAIGAPDVVFKTPRGDDTGGVLLIGARPTNAESVLGNCHSILPGGSTQGRASIDTLGNHTATGVS